MPNDLYTLSIKPQAAHRGPYRRTPKPRPEPGSQGQIPPIYIANGGGGQSPDFPVKPGV
jgi:hypothetical protein